MDGQTALITGTGRGFGRAIAERFAAEGACVALMARSRDQLDRVADGINEGGGRAVAVTGDVTDAADVAAAVGRAEEQLGPLTLFVNNAGVPGPFGPLWAVDPEAWWRAQEVHIRAPMLFLNRILPGMIERDQGRIIVVSAVAARKVAPNLSAYCTGKLAQNRLVEEAAAELAGTGVKIFAIDPGFVFTQLARETAESPDAQDDAPHDLARCAQRCVALASGRYDRLSGRYMELDDDIEAWRAAALAEGETA
jgi:NAD(P)-dependent dehydrogenase (short-subunit alcohol dehydrogenase family)